MGIFNVVNNSDAVQRITGSSSGGQQLNMDEYFADPSQASPIEVGGAPPKKVGQFDWMKFGESPTNQNWALAAGRVRPNIQATDAGVGLPGIHDSVRGGVEAPDFSGVLPDEVDRLLDPDFMPVSDEAALEALKPRVAIPAAAPTAPTVPAEPDFFVADGTETSEPTLEPEASQGEEESDPDTTPDTEEPDPDPTVQASQVTEEPIAPKLVEPEAPAAPATEPSVLNPEALTPTAPDPSIEFVNPITPEQSGLSLSEISGLSLDDYSALNAAAAYIENIESGKIQADDVIAEVNSGKVDIDNPVISLIRGFAEIHKEDGVPQIAADYLYIAVDQVEVQSLNPNIDVYLWDYVSTEAPASVLQFLRQTMLYNDVSPEYVQALDSRELEFYAPDEVTEVTNADEANTVIQEMASEIMPATITGRRDSPAERARRKEAIRLADMAQKSDNIDDIMNWLKAKGPSFAGVLQEFEVFKEVIANSVEPDGDPITPEDMAYIAERISHAIELINEDVTSQKVDDSAEQKAEETKSAKNDKTVETDDPVPAYWTAVQRIRKAIVAAFKSGRLDLSGDTKEQRRVNGREQTVIVHSEEVVKAIKRTLIAFGFTDEKTHGKHEAMLFTAFMLYRAASPDHHGKWMNRKLKDGKISDKDFIDGLNEMVNNIDATGYPFAYRYADKLLGGTLCFPMPMPMYVAEWFTQNSGPGTSNPRSVSAQRMVDYGINQYLKKVQPSLLKHADVAQKKVILTFVDAIAEEYPSMTDTRADGSPGLTPRTPADFITLSELLESDNAWAHAFGDSELLESTRQENLEKAMRARRKADKKDAKMRNRSEFMKRSDAVASNLTEYSIFAQLAAKAGVWLTASGILEKVRNTSSMNLAMDVMIAIANNAAKKNPQGTMAPKLDKEFIKGFPTKEAIMAISDAIKIMGTADGIEMLTALASDPSTVFGEGGFQGAVRNHKDGTPADDVKRGASAAMAKTTDFVVTLSTGDIIGNKQMAMLWFKAYALYMSQAARNGRQGADAETLQTFYENDPAGFFRTAFASDEGQAALKFAAQTSITGFNIFSAGIAKWTASTPTRQFLFGTLVTFFAKYSTNILIAHIPLSQTAILLGKKGFNKALIGVAAAQGAEAEADARGWAKDTDLLMIGGQEKSAKDALYQAFMVDMSNITHDGVLFLALWLAVQALGIEPPDEDEEEIGKIYRYDEWKIGGETIRANWFWGDLLKFAMPMIVGIEAAKYANAKGEDGNKLGWDIFTYGGYEVFQQNQWIRMAGVLDAANGFMEEYDTETGRNPDKDIPKDGFFGIQLRSYLIRRGIATFEPAIMREIYNETGLFGGTQHLDVSSTKIFTQSTEDDADQTVGIDHYADIKLRRDVKNSVLGGFVANVFSGYYMDNPAIQKTGYLRGERPLIENVEPFSQMWVDRLTPRTEDGIALEYDQNHPEQFTEVVAEVRKLIENPEYTAQVLRASGVVIPYNARLATDDALYQAGADLWTEYYEKVAAGEYLIDGSWSEAKYVEANTRKNEDYKSTEAMVSKLYDLRDKLWSDEIPYGAWKMNRINTYFRTIPVWKEGHPKAGQAAPLWTMEFQKDQIDIKMYPSGENKSSWSPYLKVMDEGERSFDSRAAVPWQNELTDQELVESEAEGYIIPSGLGTGEELLSLMTGGGATGVNQSKLGAWVNEYLFPARGYMQKAPDYKEQPIPEWDLQDVKNKAKDNAKAEETRLRGGGGGGWGGGGGGGGSWAPKIYSNPAYSINADRPASMYGKTSDYARFDYLRPSVQTKGSREAYRREDF